MRPRVLLVSIPALVFTLAVAPAHHARAEDHGHAHHVAPMTDADMQKWVDEYFAIHPRVGVNRVGAAAAETVSVVSFRFEADGNAGTQIDTVKILVGESVRWQFGSGSHTVTNGTGFSDPDMGTLFNQPINSVQTSLTFQFDNAGLVPYFCQPHEGFNMKGFVLVKSTSGVTPLPGNNAALGFTRSPRPNPTRAGVDFQFALNQAGQARIEVFDARGARVATVKDGTLPPGSYSGSWDGTGADGVAVGSGVYYLRMTLPGYSQSRRVVVAR